MIKEDLLNATNIMICGIILLVLIFLFRKIKCKKKCSHNETRETQISENQNVQSIESTTWLTRLRNGLQRTRTTFVSGLNEFFLQEKDKITRDTILEKLFETLIRSDVGVETSELLVSRVKNKIDLQNIFNYENFESILKTEILDLFLQLPSHSKGTIETPNANPHIVLIVGVNGVGKTTTIGKLAHQSTQNNKKVIIGAADTFRAAAIEQLAIWAERANATLIQLKEKADPASVAFESTKRAVQEKFDLCLIDTAGRLQNRQDLMQELSKISRVIAKNMVDAPHEVLLVLDASMGQNAIEQAKLFQAAVSVTGIVLTKLDGTAKGGVALAIASKLKLPIRYVGVGEDLEDLQPFHPKEYIEALFS